MKKLILMMCLTAGAVALNSCSNDDSTAGSGDYTYKIRMTDAPGPYDEVNVDIQSVAIIDGDGNTVTLDSDAGIHNLLTLNNGTSILLASRNLEDSVVDQIKITLGTNSTVVVDGETYPLTFSNADGGGLTLNVNQTLNAEGSNEILLDFDANASVVATGSNTYKIVPTIRTINTETSGSISGDTNTSLAIVTAVSANNANNHFSTSVNSAGNFKILGLAPGNYNLVVTPVLPLTPVTQTNITVTAGQNTAVNAISF